MRSPTDTRDLASMTLPDGFSFQLHEHHAELFPPIGRYPKKFGEGFTVSEVERVAWAHRADLAASEHELLEVLMSRLDLPEDERAEYRERLGHLRIMSICEALDCYLDGEDGEQNGTPRWDGTDCEDDSKGGWAR